MPSRRPSRAASAAATLVSTLLLAGVLAACGTASPGTGVDGEPAADARPSDAPPVDDGPRLGDAAPADGAPLDAAADDGASDSSAGSDAAMDAAPDGGASDSSAGSDAATDAAPDGARDALPGDGGSPRDLARDAPSSDGAVPVDGAADGGCVPALPADTGYTARAEAALAHVGPMLVPLRPYNTGTRSDCVIMSDDGHGLVARLELDRLGLAGGASPSTAEPWAAYLAQQIAALVGTGGTQGRCAWPVAGAPAPAQATAALAYALHRYGAGWSASTKDAIRAAAQDVNWGLPLYLVNGGIDIVAAELLVGEALGNATLLQKGHTDLSTILQTTAAHGGHEMNAPLYTAEHFPPLAFLQSMSDATAKAGSRILLDYELLVEAHLYQPGGIFAAPKARDYSGGSGDGGHQALLPIVWLLTGDPSIPSPIQTAYSYVIVAASEYRMPALLRSIFLDKGAGYEFWAYHDESQGAARTPSVIFDLGLGGAQVSPWQQVMLPGGAASLGVSYGFNYQPTFVASGAYARAPSGAFAFLYQYQPWVTGDTDDTGAVMTGTGLNTNPDDSLSELYDYQHLVFGRTALTLWDPTTLAKPSNVVRTHQDTRVHLPDYASLGGTTATAGAWRVAALGGAYVAWLPLGTIGSETAQSGWREIVLPGRSGGVIEIADASEFPSLAAYASDLAARYVSFTASPLAAEVDARDPATGKKVRVRLDYSPPQRTVGGVAVTTAQALGHGLMASPWVTWDATSERLTTARACYAGDVYDWKALTVTGP